MDVKELCKMLKIGWPSDDQFSDIPFGTELKELGNNKTHGSHVKKVLKNMNNILSKKPVQILEDHESPICDEGLRKFLNVWNEIQGENGIFERSSIGRNAINRFLLVAAFYHDLGKLIQRDRHSIEGYHYIVNVDLIEAERLRDMLGDYWFRLLSQLVKYHDLFGIISTGEGSVSVLIDAITFHLSTVEEQQTILSLLLFLTLADISGVISLKTPKAGTLASDWHRLCKYLKASNGDRQKFATNLIASEQNPAQAIERIRRLLLEGAPDKFVPYFDSPARICDILKVIMGTQFYDFWTDFALVCKFDYALRFIKSLENYAVEKKIKADRIIEIVVALIKELVQSYSILTKRPDGSRRRIGIEVSGWTRTSKIKKGLQELLFSDLPRGVGWAAEEATAWYLE